MTSSSTSRRRICRWLAELGRVLDPAGALVVRLNGAGDSACPTRLARLRPLGASSHARVGGFPLRAAHIRQHAAVARRGSARPDATSADGKPRRRAAARRQPRPGSCGERALRYRGLVPREPRPLASLRPQPLGCRAARVKRRAARRAAIASTAARYFIFSQRHRRFATGGRPSKVDGLRAKQTRRRAPRFRPSAVPPARSALEHLVERRRKEEVERTAPIRGGERPATGDLLEPFPGPRTVSRGGPPRPCRAVS